MEAAVATLQSLASTLGCSCIKLRERKGINGCTAQYLIRRLLDQSGIFLTIHYLHLNLQKVLSILSFC